MTIELEDVKRLHVNPGDVLVVKLPRGRDLHDVHDVLQEMFPNNKVLIVQPDVEFEVVDQGAVDS